MDSTGNIRELKPGEQLARDEVLVPPDRVDEVRALPRQQRRQIYRELAKTAERTVMQVDEVRLLREALEYELNVDRIRPTRPILQAFDRAMVRASRGG